MRTDVEPTLATCASTAAIGNGIFQSFCWRRRVAVKCAPTSRVTVAVRSDENSLHPVKMYFLYKSVADILKYSSRKKFTSQMLHLGIEASLSVILSPCAASQLWLAARDP